MMYFDSSCREFRSEAADIDSHQSLHVTIRLLLLHLQARHKVDEAGEGQRPHGAAGSGRSPSGVQSSRCRDGGDDGGAPGEDPRTAN